MNIVIDLKCNDMLPVLKLLFPRVYSRFVYILHTRAVQRFVAKNHCCYCGLLLRPQVWKQQQAELRSPKL